jgi:hypothetical protein
MHKRFDSTWKFYAVSVDAISQRLTKPVTSIGAHRRGAS